jgi:molybdenum cofactor synthesis domain-containing protein
MELSRVITVSDRSAAGVRADVSGPVLADALRAAGYDVSVVVVPDGEIPVREALCTALAEGARLIVTTGGTGVGPRDHTPEATSGVIDRELPGIAEALRAEGRKHSAHAALSRGLAGVVDPTPTTRGALIVNLPGSPKAALEGAEVLLPLAGHVLDQLGGGDH